MAQMLARMERDGWIERTPNPQDGRSSLIVLTKEGQARMPDAIETLFDGNRDAMKGFTEDETTQLVTMLIRLIRNLDRVTNTES